MIEYIKGNVFETDCDVIVHGCNAQGIMGSGIAKQVKQLYPEAFRVYRDFCLLNNRNASILGTIVWSIEENVIIANCITQHKYGYGEKRYLDYDALRNCMAHIEIVGRVRRYKSIAMPKIGAGLGGGDWNIIAQIINTEIQDLKVKVYEL